VRKLILPILLLVIIAAIAYPFVRATKPVVELAPAVSTIGQATPIAVHVTHPKGIQKFVATIDQSGTTYSVFELPQPSAEPNATFTFIAGAKTTPQLKDGKAQLIVEATSNGFPHKSTRTQQEVTVITRPPSVTADSDQHYLYLGMADLATLSLSGTWTEAGVRVGDQTFRAWPTPGGKPGYFSVYAFPWNAPANAAPVAYATNGAGNLVTSPLVFQFPKKEQPKYTQHELQIDDKFMNKVVSELDPNGSGDLVTRFVKINNEMRKANNKTLSDLRLKTADHFLWSQPFIRQAGAKTEATFADQRSYIYRGQKIDAQVHLGYDLAVTQHVGVQASNDGVVVYAAPLGIYGNCIVVDHGYGLQTIYGHLSQINVHEGDAVKRGDSMGLSGMTGMAGGDHIHFTMQLDGVQIDPKSWWDPHWIKDHIAKRVDLPGFAQ
jgi:murein DD-endopeptidase MepM/ murein hydrolase activator NlpD